MHKRMENNMNQMDNKKRLYSALIGLGVFAIVIVVFIFICTPIQYKLGIYGLAITEIILLAIALIAIKASGKKIFDVLTFRKPKFTELRGSAYAYIGAFCLSILVTNISSRFFPEIFNVSEGIGNIITSVNLPLALLFVSILPGICEEALHRGFLLHTLRGYPSVKTRVLIMGIVFGVFHLDPYRFLPTMILGMGLTYIMIKTGNILMPMLFHAINNFISTVMSFWLSGSDILENINFEEIYENISPLQTLGNMLVYVAPCILFLYLGYMRLNNFSNRNRTIVFWVVSGSILIAGYIINIISAFVSGEFAEIMQDTVNQLMQ